MKLIQLCSLVNIVFILELVNAEHPKSDELIVTVNVPQNDPRFPPKEEIPEYKHPHYDKEVLAGNMADLFTSNRHYEYPNKYDDLSRRADNIIVPIEAPLDVVLQVAEKAALMPPAVNPDEFVVDKKALRSGNYWDSYYKEDGIIDVLNPASYPLRSGIKRNVDENSEDSGSDTVYEDLSDNHNPHVLEASQAKNRVGSKLHSLLNTLLKRSKTLLFVVL